ncbi:hypothetical protein LCGC14_1396260, partial [marine sediment metagenome]
TRSEPHGLDHRVVIGAPHEPLKGAVAAVAQQLQIGDCAGGEADGGQGAGPLPQRLPPVTADRQVYKFAPMGGYGLTHRSVLSSNNTGRVRRPVLHTPDDARASGVQAALLVLRVLPPPASGADVIAGLDGAGAGSAADAGEAAVMEEVVGDVTGADVFPNLLIGPL